MAKTYTAKLDLKTWKEHMCVGCGGAYAYLLARKVQGTGSTAEKASANLQTAVARTLANATDMHPCPTCGLYQPDMIGERRARKAWWTFWVALAAFSTTLILFASYALQANDATWVMVGIGAVAALWLLLLGTRNPNADVQSNRQLVQARVTGGQVRHTPGNQAARIEEWAQPARSSMQLLVMALLLAAVIPLALPEIIRSARSWPLNGDCYPPVVGAGDETRVYMPDKITSIKGFWRGSPRAVLHEPGADPASVAAAQAGQAIGAEGSCNAVIPLRASSNQNDWGSRIEVKDDEKNNSSTPWVALTFPNSPALAGKTMTCDIVMAMEFPMAVGSSNFSTQRRTTHRGVNIHFAPAGAGAAYYALFWEGSLAGTAIILLCSLLTVRGARSFQRQASPTKIVG